MEIGSGQHLAALAAGTPFNYIDETTLGPLAHSLRHLPGAFVERLAALWQVDSTTARERIEAARGVAVSNFEGWDEEYEEDEDEESEGEDDDEEED